MTHNTVSGEFSTEIYADVSELGQFVVIRQGDDQVLLPVADDAEGKAREIARSMGCAV